MPKCECGQEAAIHIFTKICQICGNSKDVTKMLTPKQQKELEERVIKFLRKERGNEFTDEDAVRIRDFCYDEMSDKTPYPFSENDIMYVVGEFEIYYG